MTTATSELMASIERSRRLSNRLSRLIQERLGVSIYQIGILAAVEEGARHLNEVADATGQQVSSASRLVDKLVNDGLLDRRSDPDDRRAVVLALTPTGERLLADSRGIIERVMSEALGRLSRQEVDHLVPAFASFLDAADSVLDEEGPA